jgi:hypothetical protein
MTGGGAQRRRAAWQRLLESKKMSFEGSSQDPKN